MRFLSLTLRDFRNYEYQTIGLDAPRVVFRGANGQGKTNLLEALYLLSNAKAFRTAKLGTLIRWDREVARVEAAVETQGVRREIAVAIQGSRKTLFHEDRIVPGARSFVGLIDTFLLVPQDIDMIEGAPQSRRDVLDRGVFQIRPAYLGVYQQYQDALLQRNAMLRQPEFPAAAHIEVWEHAMAVAGAEMTRSRAEYVQALNVVLASLPGHLRGFPEDYRLVYKPGTPEDGRDETGLAELLARWRERDFDLGYTARGPHRDDMEMLINGVPAREHASIGQRRSLMLMYLLASLRVYVDRRGTDPVLLVDDLELDAARCGVFMQALESMHPGMQMFFTTPSREKFVFEPERVRTYEVTGGTACAVE